MLVANVANLARWEFPCSPWICASPGHSDEKINGHAPLLKVRPLCCSVAGARSASDGGDRAGSFGTAGGVVAGSRGRSADQRRIGNKQHRGGTEAGGRI